MKSMKKKNPVYSVVFALLLAVGLLLTACGESETTEQQENKTIETEQSTLSQEANSAEEQSFPFTFTDATDLEITIEQKPERIITLIPSNTEISFALGLGDNIVGVSDFDTYPEEVEEKDRIGGLTDINVEKIVSLEPDLVLAESTMIGSGGEKFDQLRDAGITVAVIPEANSFRDAYRTIELIAQATGTLDKGEEIIQNMKDKIDETVAKVSDIPEEERPKVWFEYDPTLWTAGNGTFINEMIELLNAENVVGHLNGWFQFSEEEVIALDPDVIIAAYGGTYTMDPVEEVYSRSSWADITAVKENRVYTVDPDVVQRPGPRLVEGLEQFAQVIYPDIFPK